MEKRVLITRDNEGKESTLLAFVEMHEGDDNNRVDSKTERSVDISIEEGNVSLATHSHSWISEHMIAVSAMLTSIDWQIKFCLKINIKEMKDIAINVKMVEKNNTKFLQGSIEGAKVCKKGLTFLHVPINSGEKTIGIVTSVYCILFVQ